jgi:hypothetical protein
MYFEFHLKIKHRAGDDFSKGMVERNAVRHTGRLKVQSNPQPPEHGGAVLHVYSVPRGGLLRRISHRFASKVTAVRRGTKRMQWCCTIAGRQEAPE